MEITTKNSARIEEMERLERLANELREQKHSKLPGNDPLHSDYRMTIKETLDAYRRLAKVVESEEDE